MTLGLAMTPTAQLTKEKTEKLGFMKIKRFLCIKGH